MGTGGLSWRSFAIQNWSRSNRRSHRRTRWASGASCLQSKASTTLSLACAPTAPNSSARWPSTRTSTDSATCEALRASSSRWPRNSSEAFTAFGETGGALGAPSTRSHGSQPSCFLAYLRRGFVRRTLVEDVDRDPDLLAAKVLAQLRNIDVDTFGAPSCKRFLGAVRTGRIGRFEDDIVAVPGSKCSFVSELLDHGAGP